VHGVPVDDAVIDISESDDQPSAAIRRRRMSSDSNELQRLWRSVRDPNGRSETRHMTAQRTDCVIT